MIKSIIILFRICPQGDQFKMKKIQCEVCGSNDIIKTEANIFECQYCGTKYTLEQARILYNGEVKTKAVDYEVIGGKLIKYNAESPEAEIPETVSIIGEASFKGLSGLKSVSFPSIWFNNGG